MPETLLSVADVARLLDVTPSTVTRWVREGRLESVKLPSGRNKFRPEIIAAIKPVPADLS